MKKFFLAMMAVAAVVLAGCKKSDSADKDNVPSSLTLHYGDAIVMPQLMPGYTTYEETVDGAEHAFCEGDTVWIQCIGKTVLHVTADKTVKKDIALDIQPLLTEEAMFTIPSFDWSRNRAAVVAELGQPNNKSVVGSDSCYIYYLDETNNQFAYYYFSGENFDTLNEIMVSITDNEHGEVLKLFIAERFPYFLKGTMGSTNVWVYYNAPSKKDATTEIIYYVQKGYNVSFRPYTYTEK